jgi:putative membrane protein
MKRDRKVDLVYGMAALAFVFFFGGLLGISRSLSAAPAAGADAQFAMKAAQGGMAEVKLGQLAESNGSSDAVKEFGKRMVTDHGKAGEQLRQVASQEKVELPSDMDSMSQATYDRLSKLSGAEFDREYTKAMVMDHQKDVAEFKKEARDGKNDGIKSFAAQTLPTVEDHLQQIRQIQKAMASHASSGM